MTTALLIHSTGTPPSMWGFIPDEVLAKANRVTVTNLGYPPLPLIPRGQRITLAQDRDNLLAQVPKEGDLDIVSHSYGGLLALDAMQSLRGRIRSVYLYEPVMFGALSNEASADPEAVKQAREFLEHPWFLHDDAVGGSEQWLEYFIDYWNRPGSFQRMQGPPRDLTLAVGWKMYEEVRSVFFSNSSFDERPLPNVPVTLVYGERTTQGAKATIEALQRHHPWAKLVKVEGTGHMGPLTHPDKVIPTLRAHFAQFAEK